MCIRDRNKTHQILTWIRNTSIPSIKLQFAHFETAKEVWDLLRTRYSTTNTVHQYQLHEALHDMKQVSRQSINEFLAQMQGLWDQLALSELSWENAGDAKFFSKYRDSSGLCNFSWHLIVPITYSRLHITQRLSPYP